MKLIITILFLTGLYINTCAQELTPKYAVGDTVCLSQKLTGVVKEIDKSVQEPDVIIYRVETYKEYYDGLVEWTDGWYVDLQLKYGRCRYYYYDNIHE